MRRTVLMTGGTGTVGSELLRRLVTREGTTINLLVRRVGYDRRQQVEYALRDVRREATVNVLEGDLCAGETLGLSTGEFRSLAASTTHVIHCGGSTSFTLPLDESRAINVLGTRRVLEFAHRCDHLESAAFFSTVYVSGKRRGVFSENDHGDAGHGFVNPYEQSKAEMELVVREAMHELPIQLFRLSTVVGDSRTGAVRGFNAVHHAIRLLYQGLAPMVPGEPGAPVDMVSSDYVADAALYLMDTQSRRGVHHLASGETASATISDMLASTIDSLLRFRPKWRKRSIEKPLLVDLDTYELFVRSVEETGNDVLRNATRSIRTFAYQLAHPKAFATQRTAEALAGSGIIPKPVLEFYPAVVRYCLETNWGMQPC
ncbi:MAG: SDR family oxidoreductase [Gemmatimonadaceae bacterium]